MADVEPSVSAASRFGSAVGVDVGSVGGRGGWVVDAGADLIDEEVPFEDGNVSRVVRVGQTVRRNTGAWTPAIHALLRYLREAGFTGCPEVLGMDERGREVLSFVPGETAPASLEGCRDDATLVAAARLYRSFHDAVSGFVPPRDARWRFTVGAPEDGEIVCHNDLGPWNTVIAGGQPVALIDWDFAAPAPRAWDLAYALWRWAPLYAEERFGPLAERARRIAVFCDAYGWDDPAIAARRDRGTTAGDAGHPDLVGRGGRAWVRGDAAGWALRDYRVRYRLR